MAAQVPSVGRMVHYKPDMTEVHQAAIITAVFFDSEGAVLEAVNLAVFSSDGVTFKWNCLPDQRAQAADTWHWPEYVPGTK